ncbi:BREX-1 system adenine-specific DNA-methyltransferase PglX [Defluviimonas sp. WL0024]|uniref:BREX-1 system adenine-specific DNA-methyltransferase PglX n=1 Tax=Albidovulum salinarum TaxID=2984153 RepID=A0ABT2X5W0_9RHOB|nr:BREX-1 system adenine-specific DNA-methyltransferase PglX [Defluviimonas sp. WL0024]MCU9849314.1 BREX-1 system adenine-specific DNA-methyltransferase PglX [Defluviimonas sp. WL0024]
MTLFLRLLSAEDKQEQLQSRISKLKSGADVEGCFDVDPVSFKDIPGSSFAYWVSENVRKSFVNFPHFSSGRTYACITNPAGNDTRYMRAWWEVRSDGSRRFSWKPIAKGGRFSPYYFDVHLVVSWDDNNGSYFGFFGTKHRPLAKPASVDYFFRPGITWPSRTQVFAPRIMPAGCVFTGKGPAAFDADDSPEHLLAAVALMNSEPFKVLVGTRLNAADSTARSFEVGIIQKTPAPKINDELRRKLALLARKAWSLMYALDSIDETSHAFILPSALRERVGGYDQALYEVELSRIQPDVDALAIDLYGFTNQDCIDHFEVGGDTGEDDEDSESGQKSIDHTGDLLAWSSGVAFGRFDWRLATGEREAPPEPDPFDPLPAKSPGMLPDGDAPLHAHAGILVDDQGHPHDLPRLIEEVLSRVDAEIPGDVRRWLQRDFFKLHLKQYSKSRRKAPIYWPLSTASGDYTLWLYYPDLTDQTLFTAVNDFLEPKLQHLESELSALRRKGQGRTSAEEREFEKLQTLQEELTDLRDTLLQLAPTYKPNHDDGVQITAAPLWRLFRHTPWQKVLKDTWEKLEAGDYDWAHLAMTYWPERVREKCKTDKSLAIAHDLEHLYEEPEEPAGGARKRRGGRSSA